MPPPGTNNNEVMMKLKGQVALVTGGGGAIGRAIALRLAEQGAEVGVLDRFSDAANAVVMEIGKSGGSAFALTGDLTSSSETEHLVEQAFTRCGRIDILVNCIGGSARQRCRIFHEQSLDVVKEIIDMNLYGMLYCTHAVARRMVKAGQGRIVTVSSIVGVQGMAKLVEYSAAKGAVIAATKALAKELGTFGINVNCVSPGKVQREGEMPADAEAFAKRYSYLNRICTQDDVAQVAVFLCLPASGYVTGQNYIVDGGRSLGLMGDER